MDQITELGISMNEPLRPFHRMAPPTYLVNMESVDNLRYKDLRTLNYGSRVMM